MPQNERSLERNERPSVPRDEARRVVGNRATCRNRSTVAVSTCCFDRAIVTIHSLRDWIPLFLRLRVEFDPHGIGIEIIKKSLNVK